VINRLPNVPTLLLKSIGSSHGVNAAIFRKSGLFELMQSLLVNDKQRL